jgi:hypothetical protein
MMTKTFEAAYAPPVISTSRVFLNANPRTFCDFEFNTKHRTKRDWTVDRMFVLIGALIIIVGAFAIAAIHEYVHSVPLAIVLNVAVFAAVVGMSIWLR